MDERMKESMEKLDEKMDKIIQKLEMLDKNWMNCCQLTKTLVTIVIKCQTISTL